MILITYKSYVLYIDTVLNVLRKRGTIINSIQLKILLSLNNTVCDNYTNYTNKHVTKRT
jgi:hypothetical protein